MNEPLRQTYTYSPEIFNVGTEDEAKRIILTPEPGRSTDDRWAKETPYLLDLIAKAMPGLSENDTVLDYGCAIGRMSKALIERFGCDVVGVDIAPNMRELAPHYVQSDKFTAMSPENLSWLSIAKAARPGFRVDHAISIWALQHCCHVEEDIARIRSAVHFGGQLFVVNDRGRLIPTKTDDVFRWVSDGKDLQAILDRTFGTDNKINYELDAQTLGLCGKSSFCASYTR